MKYLYGLLTILMLSGLCTKAQEVSVNTMTVYTAQLAPVTQDITTNTDTSYLYFGPASYSYNMHFAINYNWVSGTAGGSVILQGSDDAVTWDSVKNVVSGIGISYYNDVATFSSVTSGISKFDFFYVGPNVYKWKYIRARCITSGTQTGYFTGKVYARKP